MIKRITPFHVFVGPPRHASSRPRGWSALGILLAVVCATVVPPAAHAQTEASHQQFVFAYKLLQRGDDEMAAEEFDKYLGSFSNAPKRGDAMYYRALLHRRAGENKAAAELLDGAPDPQLVPPYAVHLLRGQVLSDLKQYKSALESLEQVNVDGLEQNVAVSVHYLKGLAYRGADNLSAAAAALDAAAQPNTAMRSRALLDLARVRALQDQPDEAIETLQRCIEAADGSTAAEAARLAGDLSYEMDQYDQALTFYSRVVNNHQSSQHFSAAVIGMLWSHYSKGGHQAVLQLFEQYKAALPLQDRVPVWYLAGSSHQELGNHEQAAQLLGQVSHGEQTLPIQEKVLYKLAKSQFELERYEAMRQTVGKLADQFPRSERLVDATYMLAAADAEHGNVDRGRARLAELVNKGPDYPYYRPALLRLARLQEEHSLPADAADVYGRYVEASRQANDHSEKVHQAALRQIDLLYQAQDYKQARAAANTLIEEEGLDLLVKQEALYRRALAELRQNQREQALSTLQSLDASSQNVHPYRAQSLYYRGLIHMSLDQSDQALPLLEQAAQHQKLPTNLRANALRLLAMHQRDAADAQTVRRTLHRLEELVGTENLGARDRLWLGRDALQRGEAEQAVTYLDPVTRERPDAPTQMRREALLLLGRAQRELGQFDDAVKSFTLAMQDARDVLAFKTQLELAHTHRARGDYQKAIGAYGAPANEPASPDALKAEALFGIGLAHRELAKHAARQQNPNTAVSHNKEAQRALSRVALLYGTEDFTPLPQLAYIEIAAIATEANNVDEAKKQLNDLISDFSSEGETDGPYVTFARAMLARYDENYGRAMSLLEQLRQRDNLDPRLQQRMDALRDVITRQ